MATALVWDEVSGGVRSGENHGLISLKRKTPASPETTPARWPQGGQIWDI